MLGQARRRGEVVAAAQWYKTHIDIAKVGNPVNNLMESAVAAYADNVFCPEAANSPAKTCACLAYDVKWNLYSKPRLFSSLDNIFIALRPFGDDELMIKLYII